MIDPGFHQGAGVQTVGSGAATDGVWRMSILSECMGEAVSVGSFEFLAGTGRYNESQLLRLEKRKTILLDPIGERIRGARILDLGCHDGRWAYALSSMGAQEVIGIEGRASVVSSFASLPDSNAKARVNLRVGDVRTAIREMADNGESVSIVCALGILYHVASHYDLLADIRRLLPYLIIIDGEFIHARAPRIHLVKEDPRNNLNGIPDYPGQETIIKGIPTTGALEAMADVLGYDVEWHDWSAAFGNERKGIDDYFRDEPRRRASCYLWSR